jgi:hypothetical protein
MKAKLVGREQWDVLVFVNGVLCFDYTLKDGEMDFNFDLKPNDEIRVIHMGLNELSIFKPDIKPIPNTVNKELGEPTEKRLVVADWGVLMDIVDECPHEVVFGDSPLQGMFGFICPTTGETWLITIENAKKTGPKGLDKLENRAKIITEHSVKINL